MRGTTISISRRLGPKKLLIELFSKKCSRAKSVVTPAQPHLYFLVCLSLATNVLLGAARGLLGGWWVEMALGGSNVMITSLGPLGPRRVTKFPPCM